MTLPVDDSGGRFMPGGGGMGLPVSDVGAAGRGGVERAAGMDGRAPGPAAGRGAAGGGGV